MKKKSSCSFPSGSREAKQYGCLRYVRPYHHPVVYQSFTLDSALRGDDASPITGRDCLRQCRRLRKSRTFRPGPASRSRLPPRRERVESRVRAHAANQGDTRQIALEQGGIGSIRDQMEVMFGKPGSEFPEHGFGMVEKGDGLFSRLRLAVEADVDWDGQRFSAPWRLIDKTERDILQSPAKHRVSGGGANGIPACSCAVDFLSRFFVSRIVYGKEEGFSVGEKPGDKVSCPMREQLSLHPCRFAEEIVIHLDDASSSRFRERIHAGNGSASRTQYPSHDQSQEGAERGLREYRFENAHKVQCLRFLWHGEILFPEVLTTSS